MHTKKIIEKCIKDGELNWQNIFQEVCSTAHLYLDKDLTELNSTEVRQLLLGTDLRDIVNELALLKPTDWQQIKTVVSYKGEKYKVEDDEELVELSCSPGEIDYNVFYMDGATYKDTEKATLLLDTLREIFKDKESPEYKFFFNHILMKYHTYAGIDNYNFRKMIGYELLEYDQQDTIWQEQIDNFIRIFSEKWGKHLSEISRANADLNKDTKLAILTSKGGMTHEILAATLKAQLEAKKEKVKIINETVELGQDPLGLCIEFPKALNFNEIKQQANDNQLHKSLNLLTNRLSKYTPDRRMHTLREQTINIPTVLSVNTFAHDARLAADGKKVIVDTIDTAPVNGKMMMLAMHKAHRGLSNIAVLIHMKNALLRNKQGLLTKVPAGEKTGLTATEYAFNRVAAAPDIPYFKRQVRLHAKNKLSVMSFGGQGCSGQAAIFLKTLVDEKQYPEQEGTHRDILLLGGGGYETSVQEAENFLNDTLGDIPKMTKQVTYNEQQFNTTIFTLPNGKNVHVWSKVSQEIMSSLSAAGDHFIIKTGGSIAQELLHRNAKGVIAYYDGSHPWEISNLWLLAAHGAAVVYDRTTEAECAKILQAYEGKALQQMNQELPTTVEKLEELMAQKKFECNDAVPLASILPSENLKEKSLESLIQLGIDNTACRVIEAQQGKLHKDPDRIITLKKDINASQLKKNLLTFVKQIINLSTADMEYVGTVHETEGVQNLISHLQSLEKTLISIGNDTPSIQDGATCNRPAIIIWSGFDAMDAAIHDPEGVCTFDVPAINLLFVLWTEIFCSNRSLARSKCLQSIPLEIDPEKIRAHPKVQRLMRDIIAHAHHDTDEKLKTQHAPSASTPASNSNSNSASKSIGKMLMNANDIGSMFFGAELNDESMQLAEKMGVFVSKFFVSRFAQGKSRAIVYFSDNKIDEFGEAAFATNTISWDYELPLLRALPNMDIQFRGVYNGQVKAIPFEDVLLVRNRHDPDNPLQDRRIYTCGMPGLPEWLLQSAQPARKNITIEKLKDISMTWQKKAREKSKKSKQLAKQVEVSSSYSSSPAPLRFLPVRQPR